MKKLLLGFALSIFMLSSCTVNKPAEQVRTITVSGQGSVTVEPDYVFLKFLVRTSEWNVSRAVERNAQNSNNVINAIKEVGIDENDISTADYRISQDNTKDYPGLYTVYNYISVIVRNVDLAGKIVDVAVKDKVGANGITAFEYGVTDKTTAFLNKHFSVNTLNVLSMLSLPIIKWVYHKKINLTISLFNFLTI